MAQNLLLGNVIEIGDTPDATFVRGGQQRRLHAGYSGAGLSDECATDNPASLERLEAAIHRDLDLLRYPSRSWVLPKVAPDGGLAYDAIIVGGGQSGLAAAFGLMRQRVDRVLVSDENAAGHGAWDTYARMLTLRTDKYVGGMELGLPALSLRSWFEAQYGSPAWAAMDKLPREMQCGL